MAKSSSLQTSRTSKDLGSKFELDPSFLRKFEQRQPEFGYDGLGEFTYMRTYSRQMPDGKKEEWRDTVQRVVEGTYSLQQGHILGAGKRWDDDQGQRSAQEMYGRIFDMKFTPPGRGLWAMGTAITEDKRLFAALNNCGFVSTESLDRDFEKPFTFLMDASMVGVGVGFDTLGAGKLIIQRPLESEGLGNLTYQIPDSREGWVESVGLLLRSYFQQGYPNVNFSYESIRPKGEPIKTFGGEASGPVPLMELHEGLRNSLDKRVGMPISVTDIVDIQNRIGKAVIAGNVRRTAEIAFGSPDSEEFLDLKNYDLNPERSEWGWASNNTVLANVGMDYEDIAERIRDNGEPGLAWLDNMRRFSRMGHPPDNRDFKVGGGNPCLEQSLESYELCCLVETYPSRHNSKEDFLRTLKFAYLYAKTVTLGETHWTETNEVMMRNRRIGTSVTGVTQFIQKNGLDELKGWLNDGYDEIQKWDEVYSNWFAIPRSIKTTSVKPSGSVSLLAGSTPGMHFPHSEYYIRRINVANNSELLPRLEQAGYPIEPCGYDSTSVVVEFPIHEDGMRRKSEVSMWEQLQLASFLQENWSDNQVSATVTFNPETEGPQIAHALEHYQYGLKGVSFLPLSQHGYEQAPYEEISSEEYDRRKSELGKLDLTNIFSNEEGVGEKFCNNDSCELEPPQK